MLEPQRLWLVQLASFLALSLSWEIPAPSLGQERNFTAPVIGSELVNHYRQSETRYSQGHRGVDYQVRLGQGVFAPADGLVHFVGVVVDRPVISISHEDQLLSAFEPVCSSLQRGEKIRRGDLIGEVCEADSNYQQHCERTICLHFSMRKNGDYLSPLWLTKELSASRILPWMDPANP